MCTVGGRIGWIGTRSGTARRPGIAGPTTPFAFGISPELSAENKRKRDARWLESEEREAIAKLDPLH